MAAYDGTIASYAEHIAPEKWDAFCDDNPSCWLYHRSVSLNLYPREVNLSFALLGPNGEILAICPLCITEESPPRYIRLKLFGRKFRFAFMPAKMCLHTGYAGVAVKEGLNEKRCMQYMYDHNKRNE